MLLRTVVSCKYVHLFVSELDVDLTKPGYALDIMIFSHFCSVALFVFLSFCVHTTQTDKKSGSIRVYGVNWDSFVLARRQQYACRRFESSEVVSSSWIIPISQSQMTSSDAIHWLACDGIPFYIVTRALKITVVVHCGVALINDHDYTLCRETKSHFSSLKC